MARAWNGAIASLVASAIGWGGCVAGAPATVDDAAVVVVDAATDPDAATDAAAPDPCGPGLHREQQCSECETGAPCTPVCQDACVPDADLCPYACPAGTTCQHVPMLGGDPAALTGMTHPACVPSGAAVCAAATCPAGQACRVWCHPCTTAGCEWAVCEPECVRLSSCAPDGCGSPALCTEDPFVDPYGHPGERIDFQADACELTMCWPGTTCASTCTSADGCLDTCVTTCTGPADDACRGPVTCAEPPPACPAGTVPGIAAGCWAGYCIPEEQCLHACAALLTEAACAPDPLCRVTHREECVPTPGGGVDCHFVFDVCRPAPIRVTPPQGAWLP